MSELLPCPCCGSDNSFYTAIELHRAEAAIIRAFVERVEERIAKSYGIRSESEAMHEELAAMEKETQTQ